MELLIKAIVTGYLLYSFSVTDIPTSFKDGIKQLLTCVKCLSFWVILISSGNLALAGLTSLTIFLLESFIVTKL
jgi:hypothetical protein